MSAIDSFLEIIKHNREGRAVGIYSVCSAHPEVLKAAFAQAKEDGSVILIESTSNQVDQFGGYTGMRPEDFVGYIGRIAEGECFPADRIMLGGDHLGPNAWKDLPAEEAMRNAKDLIRAYVRAGYQKIHLDASMYCIDDGGDRALPLDDAVVSERAALLCAEAESAWEEGEKRSPRPLYIIGTEVPVPGGAQNNEEQVDVTSPDRAEATLSMFRDAFRKHKLSGAWERVVGLVVQPGVEFSDDHISNYDRKRAAALSSYVETKEGIVFEAHSTDYQTEEALRHMVEDHFCILKVGPWLTFAYREALFALSSIEEELSSVCSFERSGLRDVMNSVLMQQPKFWKKYYSGSDEVLRFKRDFSFSDRNRYYWTNDQISSSVNKLIKNLESCTCPLSLISQYFPDEYYRIRDGKLSPAPMDIILSHIMRVTAIYSRACGLSGAITE
jgi:D-tagatose-1,6-bisphosphate aldolase subunit GatZ/KbaZ